MPGPLRVNTDNLGMAWGQGYIILVKSNYRIKSKSGAVAIKHKRMFVVCKKIQHQMLRAVLHQFLPLLSDFHTQYRIIRVLYAQDSTVRLLSTWT